MPLLEPALSHLLELEILRQSSLLVCLGILSLVIYRWRNAQTPKVPVVGSPGTLDFRAAMREGLSKYPDTPFLIPFNDPTIIIPRSALNLIKTAPDSSLSANGNMARRFAINYSGTGYVSPEFHSTIKTNLTHDVNSLLPLMREEISVGVNATVGKCKDWTPVQLQMNMAIIVSMLTSRVFVGLPLTRDKNWLRIIMEHVGNVMHFADRLRKYPDFLRPLVVRLLPEYTVVQNTKAAISSALEQRLLQNSAAYKACSTDNLRLSTWLMEKYKQERKRARDIQLIIRDHLTLFMAATGFPTLAVCHILIDLAAYPEYLPQLREEIENELEASAEGVLDGKVLPKLRLLDSFCKESSRMNPPGVVAELRMTHKPLVLPNGNVIPANALIAVPDPLFDQTTPVFDDCNTFDGARYVKLASNTTSADGQYAFSAISSDDLTFGYGVHACPGRHFASAEVKLIISKLIMEYDFKFEGNVVGRPKNNFVDFMTFPPTVNLLFKARGHELLH